MLLESGMELDYLAMFSRWIHLIAVIVLVGGTAFMRIVLEPSAEVSLKDEAKHSLMPVIKIRWARLTHIGIAVIVITGIFNAIVAIRYHRVSEENPEQFWYHLLLGGKILLAFGIFFIASALVGHSPALEGMRKHRAVWMAVALIVAALIVMLSVLLKQIPVVQPTEPGAEPMMESDAAEVTMSTTLDLQAWSC